MIIFAVQLRVVGEKFKSKRLILETMLGVVHITDVKVE